MCENVSLSDVSKTAVYPSLSDACGIINSTGERTSCEMSYLRDLVDLRLPVATIK